MEINLKNQIVILDEAHNIEDSARDAASGSFKLDDVEIAMKDCERMVDCGVLPEVHTGIIVLDVINYKYLQFSHINDK